jgi:cell division septum initiation protein DivIVA
MAKSALEQAMEDVYTALQNDNENLDAQIKNLKTALTGAGQKEAVFIPDRLPNNNRQGRKMMQTYFKKRGVVVTFDKSAGQD